MAKRSERVMGAGRRAAAPALAVALILAPGAGALAASPTEEIRGATDRVIAILSDPALAEQADRRRDVLRKDIAQVFDFEEMAKRSLGVNWRARTPREQQEFVAVFRELLENAYLGKIASYKGETIAYVKESTDPPYAQVDTLVRTRKQQEIPVAYRLLRKGDRWRIYDVVIEGISLVNNYRSQFAAILAKSSFDELMKKLRTTARNSRGA